MPNVVVDIGGLIVWMLSTDDVMLLAGRDVKAVGIVILALAPLLEHVHRIYNGTVSTHQCNECIFDADTCHRILDVPPQGDGSLFLFLHLRLSPDRYGEGDDNENEANSFCHNYCFFCVKDRREHHCGLLLSRGLFTNF